MKHFASALCFWAILLTNAFAQLSSPAELSYRKNKKTAKKLLKLNAPQIAVSYLEAANDKKPGKRKLMVLLANAEKSVRNYAAAENVYNSLIAKDKKGRKPEYLFFKAIAQQQQEKYTDAIENFSLFRNTAKGMEKYDGLYKQAGKAIEGSKFGVSLLDTTIEKAFKVKHLSESINTVANESAPAIGIDKTLLFERWNSTAATWSAKTLKFSDFAALHQATVVGKEVNYIGSDGVPVKGTNTHISTPSFTEDGNTLYYSVCEEAVPLKPRCDIYRSVFINNVWQKGEKLNSSINLPTATNLWACAGKAPGGEEALYFASNRNLGRGFDIFYAIKNGDGTFQRAKTLSNIINTADDEISPYYDCETNMLYFSSNGRGGLGGFDVFGAERLVIGDYLDPVNVGMPVNSGADDYGFIYHTRKNLGFVASNRNSVEQNGCITCNDDLWRVESTAIFPAVKGEVTYGRSGLIQIAQDATVALYDANSGTQLSFLQIPNGKFFFDLEKGKSYRLVAKREGKKDVEQLINTQKLTESDTLLLNLNFEEQIREDYTGKIIATVYWDYDKFQLTKTAPDSLAKVVQFMTDNPKYIVEVGSHTDNKGSDEYNLKLSERRSAAVIKYLLSKKLPENRIVNKPYGESQPAAPNTNSDGSDFEDGRRLNRRTAFKVLEEVK